MFLARDKALTPSNAPLKSIQRRSAVWMFVGIEILGFGATFAITQTVAAVGFPIFIFALIPLRALVLPRIFRPEELDVLDAPTASDFTMEGIGGSWGGGGGGGRSSLKRETSRGVLERSGDDTAVSSLSAASGEERNRFMRTQSRDSVFASPGGPRKSQEDLAELGRVQSGQSTATRRMSVDRRSGKNMRRKSSSHEV